MQTHNARLHDEAAAGAPVAGTPAAGAPVAGIPATDTVESGIPMAGDPLDGLPAQGVFPPDLHDAHHLWLKAWLLALWGAVSFGTSYFARDLQALVPGWPIAYWIAAQGAVLVFLAIIVVYCAAMDRFERRQAHEAAALPSAAPHG